MNRGVTLPELVATVSIIALVLAIAAPRLSEPLDSASSMARATRSGPSLTCVLL